MQYLIVVTKRIKDCSYSQELWKRRQLIRNQTPSVNIKIHFSNFKDEVQINTNSVM